MMFVFEFPLRWSRCISCEADPDVLSDYVIALLENSMNDSDYDQLPQLLVSKLDDFLGQNATKFVNSLMAHLDRNNEKLPVQEVLLEGPRRNSNGSGLSDEEPDNEEDDERRHGDRRRKRQIRERDEPQSFNRQRQKCRNWEKGYCSRGASCRFDHSNPPSTILIPPPPILGYLPPLPPLSSILEMSSKKARLGSYRSNQNADFSTRAPSQGSTKLIIDKIPAEFCTIAAIHDHFQRFGIITNIDLQPELNRARIQYATHEQANLAYTSPDVIFQNRFVKLFWEIPGHDELRHRQPSQTKPPARKPFEAPSTVESIDSKSQTEKLIEKRQATLKAMLDLQRQRQELMQKYIEQQKGLLAKLEIGSISEAEKAVILAELRILDESIKNLGVDTKTPDSGAGVFPTPPMPALSLDGDQTAQPIEPPKHQPILRGGPMVYRGRGARGRAGYSYLPPGRPNTSAFKLDLRPTTLKISPIPSKIGSHPSSLRKLLEPYGQIKFLSVDEPASTALVTYLQRHDAEKALHYLTSLEPEDGIVVSWENAPSNSISPPPSASSPMQE